VRCTLTSPLGADLRAQGCYKTGGQILASPSRRFPFSAGISGGQYVFSVHVDSGWDRSFNSDGICSVPGSPLPLFFWLFFDPLDVTIGCPRKSYFCFPFFFLFPFCWLWLFVHGWGRGDLSPPFQGADPLPCRCPFVFSTVALTPGTRPFPAGVRNGHLVSPEITVSVDNCLFAFFFLTVFSTRTTLLESELSP